MIPWMHTFISKHEISTWRPQRPAAPETPQKSPIAGFRGGSPPPKKKYPQLRTFFNRGGVTPPKRAPEALFWGFWEVSGSGGRCGRRIDFPRYANENIDRREHFGAGFTQKYEILKKLTPVKVWARVVRKSIGKITQNRHRTRTLKEHSLLQYSRRFQ